MSDSMHRTDDDVDAFLGTLREPEGHRELDARIRRAMPGATRTLWRGIFWGGTEQAIVGYGDLVQPRPRGESVEWFVVGLAQQARHTSLYVNAVEDGAYLTKAYAERLGRVKAGAAALTFRSPDVLDLAVLDELCAHAWRLTGPVAANG